MKPSRSKIHRGRRLHFERLESRQMLSAVTGGGPEEPSLIGETVPSSATTDSAAISSSTVGESQLIVQEDWDSWFEHPASMNYGAGTSEPSRHVIQDEPTWQSLWNQLQRAIWRPNTPAPEIDFSQHTLVVVCMGAQPSAGYGIRITSVHDRGDVIEVEVSETFPSPEMDYDAAITYPCHGVLIPKQDKPFRFVDPNGQILDSGGLVWHDLNGNGVHDAGEPGIEGAAVELFASVDDVVGNDDDVSVGVEITDANGYYSFDGVAGGSNYYLQFRTPVGDPDYAFTTQDAGTDDTLDSDANATGRTAMFTLADWQHAQTFDAGLVNDQAPEFGFAIAFGGGERYGDEGHAVATDAEGNVYVTGNFQGTADFDPGPHTYNLTSAGKRDIFVAKYSSTGSLVWARQMGGASWDFGRDIAVAADGSVYTTGSFSGTADFDPGPGTFYLASAGLEDVFVSKLDRDGNFVWARKMGGTSYDRGCGIAVASDGSVHTIGRFWKTVDFDPGVGTFHLTSTAHSWTKNGFISKLDANGNFVWARKVGEGFEGNMAVFQAVHPTSIAVDTNGNVYTTGRFSGTVDFDSGPGTFPLASIGLDGFISKLDSAGNFVWARHMEHMESRGIAIDVDGSVYTTGSFRKVAKRGPGIITGDIVFSVDQIFVSKVDSAGNLVWTRQMDGSGRDYASGIALGSHGNAYIAGSNVSMLDSAGNIVWSKEMSETLHYTDYIMDIAVSATGSIYITGYFAGTADFDPGAGTFNLTSAGGRDVFVSGMSGDAMPVSVDDGEMSVSVDDDEMPPPRSGNRDGVLPRAFFRWAGFSSDWVWWVRARSEVDVAEIRDRFLSHHPRHDPDGAAADTFFARRSGSSDSTPHDSVGGQIEEFSLFSPGLPDAYRSARCNTDLATAVALFWGDDWTLLEDRK